jgi:hypothetical protein
MELAPTEIAIKCAVSLDHSDAAAQLFARYGLAGRPDEQRTMHFFDTRSLQLFDSGVLARTCESWTAVDDDDVAINVRGKRARSIAKACRAGKNETVTFERDEELGRPEVEAFSIATKQAAGVVAELHAGRRPLEALLGQGATTAAAALGVPWDSLITYGPLRARLWGLDLPGIDGRTTVEMWNAGRALLLEVSKVCTFDEVELVRNQLSAFFARSGLAALRESKTRLALVALTRP